MVGQAITSPLFAKRGKLSARMKGQLLVRGGGVMVDDALRRFGWGGEHPVVTTVMDCDIASGAVRACRFETRGSLGVITFPAKKLWPGADQGISVSIKLEDLSLVIWSMEEGSHRNQSDWLDYGDLDITFKRAGGAVVEPVDVDRVTDGGRLALRFTLLPGTVDTFFLFGGIVPYSVNELRERLRDRGQNLASPLASTIAVKLHVSRTKAQNGRPVKLLPQEEEGDDFGLGHLPLLELVGPGIPVLPDHDDIEAELVAFLRAVQPTNNVALARLEERYSEEGFPAAASGRINYSWPSYRGPVDLEATGTATGCSLIFSHSAAT